MPHSRKLPEMSFELLSALHHSTQAHAMFPYFDFGGKHRVPNSGSSQRLCNDVRDTATPRMASRWDS